MIEHIILKLKQLEVIQQEPVHLKHAGLANYYIDIKKAYGDPEVLCLLSDCLWHNMDKNTTCVAAAGYGGLPLATNIATQHKLYLTLVRNEPKEHGRNILIDGHVPNHEDKVAIVDDVFTTGESLRQIVEAIRPTEAEILGCYVVVKRGEGSIDVPLYAILTNNDLL